MSEKGYQNKKLKNVNFSLSTIIFICIILISQVVSGQESKDQDSTKVKVNYNKKESSFSSDTGYVQKQALDIGSDRGLFILSADKNMQMRILGSVRAAFNYSDQNLSNKSSLDPYDIPTNLSTLSPNYYASLSQTRFGFEVTRQTKKAGDIFIRMEMDFASSTNNLRLRHAYGQFKRLLVGQTWSLFSNVSYTPATVSFDGIAGSIFTRTPQIRFFGKINNQLKWAAAIEYSQPDFIIPDSIKVSLLQVIPDLTSKIEFNNDLFSGSISGVITTISGRDTTDKISYGFGIGVSFSGQFTIQEKNKILFSITSGQAISHFIGVFSGQQQDAAYDPVNKVFKALPSTSGFISYNRDLIKNLIANVSLGFAAINNKDFQSDDDYSYGYNALINVFWEPVEGARLGLEFANGQRFDIGSNRGMANKISMLLYYDF